MVDVEFTDGTIEGIVFDQITCAFDVGLLEIDTSWCCLGVDFIDFGVNDIYAASVYFLKRKWSCTKNGNSRIETITKSNES